MAEPADDRINRNLRFAVIAAIAAVYVAVRMWGLTESCLWFDEVFSVHAAEHPWRELLSFVAADLIHPPLFYLTLKLWIAIGGESLLWLRLFSVFCASLAIVPFLQICREFKLSFASTAAAFALIAVNGSLIKYAQEVRMYGLLLLLSLTSIWLFSRFFFRGKNLWVLTLVNVLLVYTHYYGWFVVMSQVTAILLFQRIKIRHTAVMAGIVGLAFLPWAAAVAAAARAGADVEQNIGWIEPPGPSSLIDLMFDLVEPFYFQQSSADPSTMVFVSLPIATLMIAATALYLARTKIGEDLDAVRLLILFSSLPVAAAFLISWISPVSIWGSRHLIVVFVPALILAAIGIARLPRPMFRNAALLTLMVLIVSAFVVRMGASQPEYSWCAWEVLLAGQDTGLKDGPLQGEVLTFEELIGYHSWFALRADNSTRVIVVKGVEGIAEDPAYFLPRKFTEVSTIDLAHIDSSMIWVAFRTPKKPAIGSHPESNQRPIRALEQRGYRVASERKHESTYEDALLVQMIRITGPQ